MRASTLSTLIKLLALAALLSAAPFARAQDVKTVTLGASVTSGDGTLTTDITWSTSPPIPNGTPCTASGDAMFSGPLPDHGTLTLTISKSGTLPLSLTCTFPGSSIAVFTWVPATQNTDNSAYTNPKNVRIKYTFNPSLTAGPDCDAAGPDTCVDIADLPAARPTMHTVTGITQVGTLRARAFHQNSNNVFSAASNAVTLMFMGGVPVTQNVSLTVNPVPGAPGNFGGSVQ